MDPRVSDALGEVANALQTALILSVSVADHASRNAAEAAELRDAVHRAVVALERIRTAR